MYGHLLIIQYVHTDVAPNNGHVKTEHKAKSVPPKDLMLAGGHQNTNIRIIPRRISESCKAAIFNTKKLISTNYGAGINRRQSQAPNY